MRFTKAVLLTVFSISLPHLSYAKPSGEMLAVIEEDANYLSFYDADSGKNLGDVRLGYLPHEIAISKDQKTAYVCNFGIKDYDRNVGRPGSSISVVDIPGRVEKYRLFTFDASEQKEYANIDKAPHGIKLRPPLEKELFVNLESGSKMLVFDVVTKKIIRQFPTDPNTHNFVFSLDGKVMFSMAGPSGIFRINADTGEVTGSRKFTTPIRGLKYTPDNRYIMISGSNEVDLIDPVTLNIVKKFDNLGVGQILYSDMSPNQKYIVAPAAFDNQVVIINVETGKVLKRIITGLNPTTALVSHDNKYAYITNATDMHLSKIDLNTFKVSKIATKDSPNNIDFVSDQSRVQARKLSLGVALPLTGADGRKGRDMMRGYEFWRSLVNDAGGVLINNQPCKIQITYADTQSDDANVYPLTKDLITKNKVKILLSTVGLSGYNLEKQASLEEHIPITPAQINNDPWAPNEIAVGEDYFVTSKEFDTQLYARYGFPASGYSASASSLGIMLQKSLLQANSFDYKDLSVVMDHAKFHVFYSY